MPSNINTVLKENYDLKNELESMLARLKENEVKHKGFKLLEYSMLLADTLDEISTKTLQYVEDIFEIDRAILFIKSNIYRVSDYYSEIGSRVIVTSPEAFSFTFATSNNRNFIQVGSNRSLIHKDFLLFPEDKEYSFLIAPVTEDGEITAALGFFSSDKHHFTADSNFDFIREFALITSVALKKLNNSFMLDFQTKTDLLAELPNQTMLLPTGYQRLEDFKHLNRPFSFIMLNINQFHKINEAYGRLKGDEVIKAIADVMTETVGDKDIVGRLGGDEFYIFSYLNKKNEITALLMRLNHSINNINKHLSGFSASVAIIKEGYGSYTDFEDIFNRADKNLFLAKEKYYDPNVIDNPVIEWVE